jgi:flagellar motor switch protein FliG
MATTTHYQSLGLPTGVRKLSGREKVAALFLALGKEDRERLIAYLSEEEQRDVMMTIPTLGMISSDTVEFLFKEFSERLSDTGTLVGDIDALQRMLEDIYGLDSDRAAEILEDIRGPAGRNMWEKLQNVNEYTLAGYLKNQHPQTISVILSKVKPEYAARVLQLFNEKLQGEVILRVLKIEGVQKEIIQQLEETLKQEFITTLNKSTNRDSHNLIAEVFNRTDRGTVDRLLKLIDGENSESAEKIRRRMFTFVDLQKLTSLDIQKVISQSKTENLAKALKGVDESVRRFFYNNMGERAGKLLQDEIESLGGIRMREIDDAQAEVVKLAKQMGEEGLITIPQGTDENENRVVY